MIVPMKKIGVVVQSKDAESTLKALARTEVLHVEHQNAPVSENITNLEEKYRSLQRAIELLPDSADNSQGHDNPQELVRKVLALVEKREVLEEGIKKIKKDIGAWKEWGNFDPELIYDLEGKGLWVRLCKLTKKQLRDIPEGAILEELLRKRSVSYCVIISREEIRLPFETLQLPEQGLQEMSTSLKQEEQKLEQVGQELKAILRHKNALLLHKKRLSSIIEFDKVTAGMGKFHRLSYLRGYCPLYNVKRLEKLAQEEKWGLIVEDPGEADNVPTLIKNPRCIEIIKPVFQMINTIPSYKEVDISLWFLLFFSVFFGMLIGDAGYGIVFFVLTLFSHLKFRNKLKNKSIFFLTYVLSICAIIWGVLTGTFFGQAYLPGRVEPLLPFLRETSNVQALCFFIGAFHLSIAHAWKFIRKMPSLKAFSEAGWICMLWGAYFLAKSLILGQMFPAFGKTLFIGGAVSIILFTNPRKNVFRGIGSGVGDLLLHIVNAFTDVVSYIRLFAVGAATVAVADAFNQMALGIGFQSILAGFFTALILLFGHTLNILLGAMAILVHGVRLNVLEFSSHLDMEWSGVEYAPFKNE
ncbi:V-type ATP synthase subunit I [Candidatus Omnitrophota bacterium]